MRFKMYYMNRLFCGDVYITHLGRNQPISCHTEMTCIYTLETIQKNKKEAEKQQINFLLAADELSKWCDSLLSS